MQAFCMILWSLAELRFGAPACFDALADAGAAALGDPARRKRFACQELAMCLWVCPIAAPLRLPLLLTALCLLRRALKQRLGVPRMEEGRSRTEMHPAGVWAAEHGELRTLPALH